MKVEVAVVGYVLQPLGRQRQVGRLRVAFRGQAPDSRLDVSECRLGRVARTGCWLGRFAWQFTMLVGWLGSCLTLDRRNWIVCSRQSYCLKRGRDKAECWLQNGTWGGQEGHHVSNWVFGEERWHGFCLNGPVGAGDDRIGVLIKRIRTVLCSVPL